MDSPHAQHVRTTELSWEHSPRRGVWRKRLFHRGGVENGIVTSLVRFDPSASFQEHDHPKGGEILVLPSVFSDHTGDHQPGTHLLNPEGFSHAPFSQSGCLLFVRLLQHEGRSQVTSVLKDHGTEPGFVRTMLGYDQSCHRELLTGTLRGDCPVSLGHGVADDAAVYSHRIDCFVVDGSFSLDDHVMGTQDWLSFHQTSDGSIDLSLSGSGRLYVSAQRCTSLEGDASLRLGDT